METRYVMLYSLSVRKGPDRYTHTMSTECISLQSERGDGDDAHIYLYSLGGRGGEDNQSKVYLYV
jgi:hypothetical protein